MKDFGDMMNQAKALQESLSKIQDEIKSISVEGESGAGLVKVCLLYTSPSPRDRTRSRMPSSA